MNLTATVRPVGPEYDASDICFSLMSSVLLWMLVPGSAFIYSGGSQSKNALTVLMLPLWSSAVVFLQWWIVGYSLVFGNSGNSVIGSVENAFLIGVYDNELDESKKIPALAFCLYQGITATLGPALIYGIVAERGRALPAIVFALIWTTFVYDFVAYWSLNPNGWACRLGFLDFGGGAPVHLPVGAAALAYSLILGPLNSAKENPKPHNMPNVVLGTVLVWISSFGYNAGSAFASNLIAIMACVTTNLSASTGAIIWASLDYIRDKNFSAFGFCIGSLCGLVSIVPASGLISPSSGVAIGALSSSVCYLAFFVKEKFPFHDVLDVFILNGIGGLMGNVLTGVFAQKIFGGKEAGNGGWLDGHWVQVLYQLAESVASFGWSFVISYGILFGMNKTKWFHLRVSDLQENVGIDHSQVGTNCYEFIDSFVPVVTIDNLSKQFNISNGTAADNESVTKEQSSILTNEPLRNNWIIIK